MVETAEVVSAQKPAELPLRRAPLTTRAWALLRRATRAAAAGRRARDRARLFLAAFYYWPRLRLPALPMRLLRVEVRRRDDAVVVTLGHYHDLEVLRELYVEGEYDVPLPERADVIFDLGSNIGLSMLDFRLLYPDATIYGFEPDPTAFELLTRNTHGDPRAVIHKVAVASEDRTATLYSSQETWASSLTRTRPFQRPVEVATRSLDSLMRELAVEHIDLLKMDIEGSEADVLDGFAGIDRVSWMVGELHLDMLDCTAEEFFAAYLEGFEVEVQHEIVAGHCKFTAVARCAEDESAASPGPIESVREAGGP